MFDQGPKFESSYGDQHLPQIHQRFEGFLSFGDAKICFEGHEREWNVLGNDWFENKMLGLIFEIWLTPNEILRLGLVRPIYGCGEDRESAIRNLRDNFVSEFRSDLSKYFEFFDPAPLTALEVSQLQQILDQLFDRYICALRSKSTDTSAGLDYKSTLDMIRNEDYEGLRLLISFLKS